MALELASLGTLGLIRGRRASNGVTRPRRSSRLANTAEGPAR
jgi:hypothetical protein